MPFVKICITRENEPITREQKQALIAGATDLLKKVINRGPSTTVVVIEEVDTDNYGVGGESITLRRARET
ncbi:MAG: tautomerase [Desulfuromonas sp.]|nr:MAG: tautomerase [Desulfuromonas sp.]